MSTSTTRRCDACGLPPRLSTDGSTVVPLRRCSRCHKTFYHDVMCQREHFAQHKKQCRRRATDDSNKTISPLFRIEERSNKGRCLVACQVIAMGQRVSAPVDCFQPLVPPVLNEANRHCRCAFCFAMLNPSCTLQYDNNSHVPQYPVLCCSNSCRQQGQQWLQEEEQFVADMCQYSPRISVLPTAILLYRVLRNIAAEEASETQRSLLKSKVDNLEAHDTNPLSPDEKHHMQAVVTLTMQLLNRRAQCVDEKEQSLLQSFSMHYMIQTVSRMKTNGFSICNGESVALGIGLFDVASNINHSCRPNALQTFVCGRQGILPSLRVTACTTIQANEEICISYIDNACPRHLRRQRLDDDYHFWCTCVTCCDDAHDDKLIGVLCRKKECGGQGTRTSQTELAPQNASWQCTVCGNTDFVTATDLMQTFHAQERNVMILKDQEHVYATLKQAFSSSSWYVYESGEKLAQSLLDAIDRSDERETRRLCEKAHQVFVELLASPLVVEDKSWRVLKRQVLMYKRAKLCLYLFPDPRVGLSDLQNVMDTMAVYYPKDHEFIRGLEETMAQALS